MAQFFLFTLALFFCCYFFFTFQTSYYSFSHSYTMRGALTLLLLFAASLFFLVLNRRRLLACWPLPRKKGVTFGVSLDLSTMPIRWIWAVIQVFDSSILHSTCEVMRLSPALFLFFAVANYFLNFSIRLFLKVISLLISCFRFHARGRLSRLVSSCRHCRCSFAIICWMCAIFHITFFPLLFFFIFFIFIYTILINFNTHCRLPLFPVRWQFAIISYFLWWLGAHSA